MKFTERSARVELRLDIDIKNQKDVHIYALTENVSIGGVAFRCSIEERNKLTPQGVFVDEGRPVEVGVKLQLDNEHGQKEGIHSICRVVYTRRVAQDKCQIGLCFINFFDDGHDKFMAFIENALKQ